MPNRIKRNQYGFTSIEIVAVLLVLVLIGAAGVWVYHTHTKDSPVTSTTTKTSTTKTKSETNTNTTPTHTAQDAVAFTQSTYDNYLIAVNKANNDSGNTQPVAQVGLVAVKNNLSTDLYAKAAAVTQATPFSCTAQYVAYKYTASLASSDKTSALVTVSISNGSGLSTNGMSVNVNLNSLKITAVTCPI